MPRELTVAGQKFRVPEIFQDLDLRDVEIEGLGDQNGNGGSGSTDVKEPERVPEQRTRTRRERRGWVD